MWLIVLEALLALVLLLFIVWWTMFSGRKRGEPVRPDDKPNAESPTKIAAPSDSTKTTRARPARDWPAPPPT